MLGGKDLGVRSLGRVDRLVARKLHALARSRPSPLVIVLALFLLVSLCRRATGPGYLDFACSAVQSRSLPQHRSCFYLASASPCRGMAARIRLISYGSDTLPLPRRSHLLPSAECRGVTCFAGRYFDCGVCVWSERPDILASESSPRGHGRVGGSARSPHDFVPRFYIFVFGVWGCAASFRLLTVVFSGGAQLLRQRH